MESNLSGCLGAQKTRKLEDPSSALVFQHQSSNVMLSVLIPDHMYVLLILKYGIRISNRICTSRYTERLPSPLERFHQHTSLNTLSQNRPCPFHLFQPGLTPRRSSRSIHGVILSLKSSAKRSMVVWTYVPVSPSRKHTSSSLRSMRPRGRVQSRSMERLS